MTLNANNHSVWRVNRSEVMAQILIDTKAVTAGAIASRNLLYKLDWQWGRARPQPKGQGWFVTNNLGYRVMVHRGYLTTHSLELIPCDPATATLPPRFFRFFNHWGNRLQLFAALLPERQDLNPLQSQPAFAGHGPLTYNPSRMVMPYVESLVQPAAIQRKPHSVPKAVYCKAHYLIARATGAVQNQPDNRGMDDLSLWIEGEYTAPNATVTNPFVLKTSIAWGSIMDAIASPGTSDRATKIVLTSGKSMTRVTLRRNLGSMFDGVDFENMSESERARAILRSLARSVETIVTQQ